MLAGQTIGVSTDRQIILNNGDLVNKNAAEIKSLLAHQLDKWGLGQVKPIGLINTTGELLFNTQWGFFTIDTPQAKAFVGFMGTRPIELKDFSLSVTTDFCAVSCLAMDRKLLAESQRMLISAVARCEPNGWIWNSSMRDPVNTGVRPMMAQPVNGELKLAVTHTESMKAYALSPEGERLEEIPLVFKDHGLALELNGRHGCLQYELCAFGQGSDPQIEQRFNVARGQEAEKQAQTLQQAIYQPESSVIVAIEGEAALKHNLNQRLACPTKHGSLSGGRWITHEANYDQGTPDSIKASYEFAINEPGRYRLWAREFWIQLASTVKFRVDGGEWHYADRRTIFRDVAPRISGWMWIDIDCWGETELTVGRHTLEVCLAAPDNLGRHYRGAFDLFMFIKGPYCPATYQQR